MPHLILDRPTTLCVLFYPQGAEDPGLLPPGVVLLLTMPLEPASPLAQGRLR